MKVQVTEQWRMPDVHLYVSHTGPAGGIVCIADDDIQRWYLDFRFPVLQQNRFRMIEDFSFPHKTPMGVNSFSKLASEYADDPHIHVAPSAKPPACC